MPDDETIEIDTEIITSSSTPSGSSFNSGFISATVIFVSPGNPDGRVDASKDVMQLTTDQGTSKQEGDATAKLTVTLHNNNNYYANNLIPQMSEVQALITIERNIISGSSIVVERTSYPVYFGVVQEVQLTHENCVVECGDESSKMEASAEYDLTFFPDKTAYDRTLEILNAIDPRPNFDIVGLAEETKNIQIESFLPATQSGQSSMSQMLKGMSLDWATPSDRLQRLVIFNKEITYGVKDWLDLTPFITELGDSESIIGHCNVITVIGDGNLSATGYEKNVISSDSEKTVTEWKNEESIAKYGKIESKSYTMPWLSTVEEIEGFASNLRDLYESYEDRTLTPTLVSIIPFLADEFQYHIIGNTSPAKGTPSHPGAADPIDREIMVKMLRKQISYDTGGVVVQTECIRKEFEEKILDPKITGGNLIFDALQPLADGRTYDLWYKREDGTAMVYMGATRAEAEAFRDHQSLPGGRDFEEYDPIHHPGVHYPY